MAWADTPYATVQEYRARNGRVSTNEDTLITSYLLTISRLFDRRVGVAPAHFAPQTSVTATFMGRGENLLRLRDERGWQHFLRAADSNGIDIDSEADGTFDGYQLDLSDAWVRGYPVNAATFGEPYTALEILPGVANADPVRWASGVEVRITGTWGYASVPGVIRERVVGITRELLQVHLGGPAVDDIEMAIESNVGARSLMRMLEQEYNHRMPAFA